MGIFYVEISVDFLSWIYTDRLFGGAMKKANKQLFLRQQFEKATPLYFVDDLSLPRFKGSLEGPAQNPRSCLLLACLSRPPHAFTVRHATEYEGRGALKPILEEGARRNEKSLANSRFEFPILRPAR